MKARFILFFLIVLFLTGSSFTTRVAPGPGDEKELVLEGELDDDTGRQLASTIPVQAVIRNNTLFILFDSALGEVDVLINGRVKASYLVDQAGMGTQFSLAGYAPGTYTLEFTTSQGGYVYGDFTIG